MKIISLSLTLGALPNTPLQTYNDAMPYMPSLHVCTENIEQMIDI